MSRVNTSLENPMPPITDEYMNRMLATTRGYTIVLLKPGPRRWEPGIEKLIWEHGRRNFSLRAEGKLSIVCPISAGKVISGLCIFSTDVDETKKIMDDDPAVKEHIFIYETYPCRSFPGDMLPE